MVELKMYRLWSTMGVPVVKTLQHLKQKLNDVSITFTTDFFLNLILTSNYHLGDTVSYHSFATLCLVQPADLT